MRFLYYSMLKYSIKIPTARLYIPTYVFKYANTVDVTGNYQIKMATAIPEMPLYKLVDKTSSTFQRRYPYFEARQHDQTIMRILSEVMVTGIKNEHFALRFDEGNMTLQKMQALQCAASHAVYKL